MDMDMGMNMREFIEKYLNIIVSKKLLYEQKGEQFTERMRFLNNYKNQDPVGTANLFFNENPLFNPINPDSKGVAVVTKSTVAVHPFIKEGHLEWLYKSEDNSIPEKENDVIRPEENIDPDKGPAMPEGKGEATWDSSCQCYQPDCKTCQEDYFKSMHYNELLIILMRKAFLELEFKLGESLDKMVPNPEDPDQQILQKNLFFLENKADLNPTQNVVGTQLYTDPIFLNKDKMVLNPELSSEIFEDGIPLNAQFAKWSLYTAQNQVRHNPEAASQKDCGEFYVEAHSNPQAFSSALNDFQQKNSTKKSSELHDLLYSPTDSNVWLSYLTFEEKKVSDLSEKEQKFVECYDKSNFKRGVESSKDTKLEFVVFPILHGLLFCPSRKATDTFLDHMKGVFSRPGQLDAFYLTEIFNQFVLELDSPTVQYLCLADYTKKKKLDMLETAFRIIQPYEKILSEFITKSQEEVVVSTMFDDGTIEKRVQDVEEDYFYFKIYLESIKKLSFVLSELPFDKRTNDLKALLDSYEEEIKRLNGLLKEYGKGKRFESRTFRAKLKQSINRLNNEVFFIDEILSLFCLYCRQQILKSKQIKIQFCNGESYELQSAFKLNQRLYSVTDYQTNPHDTIDNFVELIKTNIDLVLSFVEAL